MTRAALLGLALLLLPAAALAQTSAQTSGGPHRTGPQTLVPAPAPNPDTPGGAAQSGVIQPPGHVDPGIAQPPPPVRGAMPVIPPPGAAGGNPRVKPK